MDATLPTLHKTVNTEIKTVFYSFSRTVEEKLKTENAKEIVAYP
jgi:hypothetical protein